jgi:superfamily II DNA helicase RecQ
MKIQFFTILALDPAESADELNQFCAGRKVIDLERQFVAAGGNSFWSICVCYQEAQDISKNRKGKVDYREVLNEKDFALFVTLRSLRKEQAEKEGVPPYALFTNEQLAEMIRRNVSTLHGLSEIKGVGEAKMDKYGRLFLDALGKAMAAEKEHEANPD